MHTKTIQYTAQDIEAHSFLAYDTDNQGQRPGILVFHDWTGRNTFACDKAQQLAELGYVALAVDVYGQAKQGKNNDEKLALMSPLLQNRRLLLQRIVAAYQQLKQVDVVDIQKTAAIGFCFGGLCALDLARSGAELRGVVSLHGALHAPQDLTQAATIQAKVLALHGSDDPMVAAEEVAAFTAEMSAAKVDWQLHTYGQTMHAFTNPVANDPDFGTVYNPVAAERSWQSMQNFFDEIFAVTSAQHLFL